MKDIKLRNSTIEKLKHICNEERSIKESYIMKAKGVQDNLDKLELKTKALEKINENYRIEREEDSYAENIKFKNPSLSKKTPSKKMFAKDNRNVENINLNYFSKSLQK